MKWETYIRDNGGKIYRRIVGEYIQLIIRMPDHYLAICSSPPSFLSSCLSCEEFELLEECFSWCDGFVSSVKRTYDDVGFIRRRGNFG